MERPSSIEGFGIEPSRHLICIEERCLKTGFSEPKTMVMIKSASSSQPPTSIRHIYCEYLSVNICV